MEFTYEIIGSIKEIIEKIYQSNYVKTFSETQKGLFEFSLKLFPNAKLQLSPNGKLNIYCNSIEQLHEILIILRKIIQVKFKLDKVVPSIKEMKEMINNENIIVDMLVHGHHLDELEELIEEGLIKDE